MNLHNVSYRKAFGFLNGVCRHEQPYSQRMGLFHFLNGVCRHEPLAIFSRL
ncbi:hypothetical protein ACRRTF_13015 [Acinetobacter baumannii]